MINYGKQQILKEDITSVVKTLKSDYLTTGPNTILFENNFKRKIKSKYAVSCSSGTTAIHLALLAMKISKGDVVILPVINFIASLNILETLGAKVFFADININTGQMSPKNLLDCIKKNKLKKIKAVLTMYNGGDPLNAEAFFKIKKKYKFYLMEDACHALGGKYYSLNNSYVGSCKFGDIATFSFHPIKTLTTCEGGMITTNNKSFFNKIKMIRNHGMLRKKSNKKNYYWKYKIMYPGYNFRLSDVDCSLGISQLKRIDKIIKTRKNIAAFYVKNLKSLKEYINLPSINSSKSAFHLFIITFNLKKLKINRDKIIQYLYKYKIVTQVHYIPVNTHPYYKKYSKLNFVGAYSYFNSCLSLPIYPGLNQKEINYICSKIKFLLHKFKRN